MGDASGANTFLTTDSTGEFKIITNSMSAEYGRTTGGVIIPTGGACIAGPNKSSGAIQTAGNGSVAYNPLGTSFDPNGGYYYARINFNF